MRLTWLKKYILGFLIIIISSLFVTTCAPTTAVKPTEATHQKGKGKFLTNEGYTFSYKFYPTDKKGPSVIYIPGMGGRVAWRGQGGYALASPLNKAHFNFIGFDRAGALSGGSLRDHIRNAAKRGKSGSVYFPTIDGKESASENIVSNEVLSVIEFIERAPTHDSEKGIYLIGASMGSWVSLVTVHSFPDRIKGVIFLSPAILPEMIAPVPKRPQFNPTNYLKSLIKSFEQRPALAIGSKSDIIAPFLSKDGSALDGALLLREKIGSNIEVMEVSSSLHSGELVDNSREVREKIAQWLVDKAYGK